MGLLRGTSHGERNARAPSRLGPCPQGPLLPVPRHAGFVRGPSTSRWDTHGLPVEVEVEKKLGITGKKQIEDQVGSAEVGSACAANWSIAYINEFTRLTTRIGYWLDTGCGLLDLEPVLHRVRVVAPAPALQSGPVFYEDLKVVPYCPRCGTALSARGWAAARASTRTKRTSQRCVRFPIVDPDPALLGDATALAVWTTTPWTLLWIPGVAVNPRVLAYAVVDGLIVAADLVDARVRRRARPADLAASPR